MSYYIKFEDGVSVGHPQALESLQSLYENFLDNAQSLGFYPIEVMSSPIIAGNNKTLIAVPQYALDGSNATMTYVVRAMTSEEKTNKYNELIDKGYPLAGWILNSDTLWWEPPVPEPADGNIYIWSNETQSWIVNPE